MLLLDLCSKAKAAAPLLTALLLLTFNNAHAQLEVSWAHTVQGIGMPWSEYWHDAGSFDVDPWGNVAIASYGFSPVTMNGDTTAVQVSLPATAGGGGDGFVGRYRADGTPSWGFWVGSPTYSAATGVAVDNEGNVYLSYFFEGPFDVDPGPDTTILALGDGDRDLAIMKYDSTGQFLHVIHLIAKYNNPSCGQISRMAFDADNNLYLAGYFTGRIDLDPSSEELILTGNGTRDCAFVAKYDPQGNLMDHLLLRSTHYESDVMDIVVDPDGSFFIAGIFSVGLDLDNGPDSMLLAGPTTAAFAAHYNADFSPNWGKALGGDRSNRAFAACRGADGGYIITGQFDASLSITLADGTVQDMSGPSSQYSTYLAALNTDGEFVWFKRFVSGQRGDIKQLAAKDDGTFYTALHYFGPFNMDPGASDFTVSTSGFPIYDMGLARYTMAEGDFVMGHAFTGGGSVNYNHIKLQGSVMYMSGLYSTSIMPDIPATSNVLTPGGLALIKYCHVPQNITYSVEDTLTICPGDDALLVAYGAEQFRWYDTALGGTIIAVGDSLQVPSVQESFTVYVEGLNGICASQRNALTVLVRPQVSLSADSVFVCAGEVVLLSFTGLADVFSPSVPEAFTTGFIPAGDMSVWVTATDVNGCSATDSTFIQVLPSPLVTLQLMPDSVCLLDAAILLAGESPAGGTWTGEGVLNDTLWSPLWSGIGAFQVSYTVTDNNGCSATATDVMRVIVCSTGIAEDSELVNGIILYPVPASAWIEVRNTSSAKPTSISVLDAQGRIVLREQATQGPQRIDVSGLAIGHYVMRVELADQTDPEMPYRVSHRSFVVLRDR